MFITLRGTFLMVSEPGDLGRLQLWGVWTVAHFPQALIHLLSLSLSVSGRGTWSTCWLESWFLETQSVCRWERESQQMSASSRCKHTHTHTRKPVLSSTQNPLFCVFLDFMTFINPETSCLHTPSPGSCPVQPWGCFYPKSSWKGL